MKKIALLFCTLICANILIAQPDFTIGNITYRVTSRNTVKVHDYNDSDSVSVIPSTVTYQGETYTVSSIGFYAFDSCTNLTSVIIPNSVTSIEPSAFYDCASLTSIIIPGSVTSIGYRAFQGCRNLTSITFSNGLSSIDYKAFLGCRSLTSITIPNSVTYIATSAFQNCNNLRTLYFNAVNCSNFILDMHSLEYGDAPPFYNCPISTIYIGDNVQRIPEYFSYGIDSLTSITIPNSVGIIGKGAFQECSGLHSIVLPNSLPFIADNTFNGCTSLDSIIIPNTVSSIGNNAFENCSSLDSITIPNSVSSIGTAIFKGCTSLGSIIIPNTISSIENNAFENCSSLDSISIPNSVTGIGTAIFKGCTGLNFINLPDSITNIGNESFRNCSNLTSITIPGTISSIGNNAFNNCSNLREVISLADIPPSLGSSCFSNIANDATVKVPCIELQSYMSSSWTNYFSNIEGMCDDVDTIIYAYICPGGTYTENGFNVSVPGTYFDTLQTSNNNDSIISLVLMMNQISTTTINATIYGGDVYNQNGFNVSLPGTYTDTLQNINGCDSIVTLILAWDNSKRVYITDSGNKLYLEITSDTMPRTVAVTSYSATSPDSLVIPSTVTYNGTTYSVTKITSSALKQSALLNAVVIPNSVTTIGDFAFWDSPNLTSVIMGDSVSNMGNNIFYECISLRHVTLSNALTYIAESTFDRCSSLVNITIPPSIKEIKARAFNNCSSLDSIILPNVEVIGVEVFKNCTSLSYISYSDSTKKICKNAIYNTAYYNNPGNWMNNTLFANNYRYLIKANSDITGDYIIYDFVELIAECAFEDCNNPFNVTMPSFMKKIDDKVFYNCTGLESITLPDSLEYIGKSTFEGCINLDSISFPTNLYTIDNYAFKNCSSLTSVYLHHNIKWFGADVFNYCNNLETVYYNCKNANNIKDARFGMSGSYPFRNCENLTTVIFGDSVSKVPNFAFSKVYSLKNVVFSNSIDTIGNSSFEETDIENLVLSNSIKFIDLWGFYKCSNLKNITFGSSFNRTEYNSFLESKNIETVTCKSMTPPSAITLSTRYSNPIVYVPCGTGNAYRNSRLNNFGTIVESDSIFNLLVFSSDTTLGTVQVIRDSCTSGIFQAIPKEGSCFVCWNDGNTDNPRTIVLNKDTTFIASFMQLYRIDVLSGNDAMGTVTGSGFFDSGSEITISAVPLERYKFIGWNDGCMDNPRRIVVTGDSIFTANFAEKIEYTITVSSEDQSMGLTTGGGVFYEQTIISIVATPRTNYHFKEWSDGDTNKVRSIMVVCDSVLIARFERNVSTNNIDNLETLEFYPNPTSGIITFNHTDIQKVEVLDAMGKIVMICENKHIIDFSKLSKGYYTMCITTSKGITVRKVIRK